MPIKSFSRPEHRTDYLYTGTVFERSKEVKLDQLLEVLSAANYFDIPGLLILAMRQIVDAQIVSPENLGEGALEKRSPDP